MYFWSLGYCFAKRTDQSCCVTDGKFDKIGGLQKSGVTHEECREFCSSYDWCYGIQITYDGATVGRRKKRGVHNDKCRLLAADVGQSLSGWTFLNKNNWIEPSQWHDCSIAYGGYNCYEKYAPG